MPYFEGTISEFTKFIGSYCRIKVMHVTTKYRKEKGRCEECGSTTKQLEAAHVRGKERPLIISNILSQYIENDIIKVDLKEFEERFVVAHMPIEETIRILCKDCHREYDKVKTVHEYIPLVENVDGESDFEKLEKEEGKIIEKLMKQTLKKSEAIEIINSNSNTKKLKSVTTIFSNINAAIDTWWLEPNIERFKSGFDFILNYPDKEILFHFYLPANEITSPKKIFSYRSDKDAADIYIPKSETKFIDRRGFDFGKFLIGKINY